MAIAAIGAPGIYPQAHAATRPRTCASLQDMAIGAQSIGMPTRGAVVTSARPIADEGRGTGAYCEVSGAIRSADPEAPDIQFQIALPDQWNGRALMLGGAGFNGRIPSLTSTANIWGASRAPLPLSRGYAVFASDSGHQSRQGAHPGSFGSNIEAVRNYAGDALKKTRDVAIALISSRYGRAPARSYFIGYSKGGGEALAVAQRWPADWDGVVAGGPGWNVTVTALNMLVASQAFAAPGAWLNEEKRQALYRSALSTCDGLDGLEDGIISNVRSCASRFDPSTATHQGVPLRCPGGVAREGPCLSDPQLAALARVNEPTRLSYALAHGEASLPGYPVYISGNNGGEGIPARMVGALNLLGSRPPAFPVAEGMPAVWSQADGYIRHIVAGNPELNVLNMDIASADGLATLFQADSALYANVYDLSAFMQRGGRLLLWTGTADMSISPRDTQYYYSRVQAAMGPGRVDSFMRYYEIPGAQHGPSTVFQPEWDQLAAIESWVENGADPADALVVTDATGVPGRTRPMCRFPTWPRYRGTGDVNQAASFTCSHARPD